MQIPATKRLSLTEQGGIVCFLLFIVAFGVLVEYRSAFLSRRMGDLGCYLRGAWAARVGEDMYGVTDDNKWHFNYPPLYAIMLIPFADPPIGEDTTGYLPYSLTVGIFYVLNVALLFYVAHLLASAIERHAADGSYQTQPLYCRRWWALRLWPLFFCLPGAAQTMMRAQVNHLVISLLCLYIANLLDGRRMRAGVFLAFAICIKVIPAFLLVYPVWKRDVKSLAGCTLGLVLGLVVIPLAAFGPTRTINQYQRYGEVFFGPLLGLNDDESRKVEILGVNATDSVGVKNMLNNWVYFQPESRPASFSPTLNRIYQLLGIGMTAFSLWPRRARCVSPLILTDSSRIRGLTPPVRFGDDGWFTILQISGLIHLMALVSPICHLHYLIYALPHVMILTAWQWRGRTDLKLSPIFVAVIVCFILSNTLPSLPPLQRLKDLCIPGMGSLPIWFYGVAQLYRTRATLAEEFGEELRLAA